MGELREFERNAFIWDDVSREEIEVDQVRFAIGTRERGLMSTEWLATTAHGRSNDLFLTTKGLARDIKVSFHDRDVVVAFVAEKAKEHRERGLLAPGESRQRNVVLIPGRGAWEACLIDFVYGTLRPPERALPIRPGKPITLVEPPKPGHLTRIFIVHSYDHPGVLELPDKLRPEPIAGLQSGSRFLRIYAADIPVDLQEEYKKLTGFISQLPDFEEGKEIAARGDLAAVLWGNDASKLNFCEVHNIVPADSTKSRIEGES